MTGLIVLIPVALGLGLMGLAAFLWAMDRGQFDDLDGAALRMLIDEEGDGPPRPAPAPATPDDAGR